VVENCRRQTLPLAHASRRPILTSAHCASLRHQRLRNFCINKNKNGSLISNEDRMLIKVLHQEKG